MGSGGYNLDWEYASNGQVPANAVPGGRDASGETYYVGRARVEGNYLMPGKVQPSQGCIYYPYRGEKRSNTYEVLVNRTGREHLSWVQAHGNHIPPNAVLCGHQEHNEQTYIGRHMHERALVIGKVQPSFHCLYVPYGGREVQYKDYEILVSNETPVWNPNTFMGQGFSQPAYNSSVGFSNMSSGPAINPWGGASTASVPAQINPFGGGTAAAVPAQINPFGGAAPPPFNPNFDGNQRNW